MHEENLARRRETGIPMRIMKTVGAEVLRDECSGLLDELGEEGVLITRGGKTVAKLLPWKDESAGALIGSLKGKIRIMGDILSTGEKWDATNSSPRRAWCTEFRS